MNNPKPTIDGKPGLLAFVKEFNPRHEHSIVDLELRLRRLGFEVLDVNEDRMILAGPFETTTAVRTQVLFGGRMVIKHFSLLKGLELLTETGLPLWRNENEQFQWHCRQLEQCDSFQVPAREEFANRKELETHLESCVTCKPANRLLTEAIDLGSSRYGDQHLRELIEKSHADQEAAIKFYTGIRDSRQMTLAPIERPQRTRREQVTV